MLTVLSFAGHLSRIEEEGERHLCSPLILHARQKKSIAHLAVQLSSPTSEQKAITNFAAGGWRAIDSSLE